MSDLGAILITGATDGIGREAARQLAASGRQVIVHGRTLARATAAADEIAVSIEGKSSVDVAAADFSSLEEVRSMVRGLTGKHTSLAAVINNAGVWTSDRRITVDGLELGFQVNHLAHFVLTAGLLPLLTASTAARVVNVSAQLHTSVRLPLDWSIARGERSRHDALESYAFSKLCQVAFGAELASRIGSRHRLVVTSVHPGVISTKMLRVAFGMTGAPLNEGGRALAQLAVDPAFAMQEISGSVFSGGSRSTRHRCVDDPAVREEIWSRSETFANERFPLS